MGGYILNEDLKKVGKKNAKVFRSNLGTPQGIVLSPIFSNIVLHELDEFIQDELKIKFTKGNHRKANLSYRKWRRQIKSETDLKKRRVLINQCFKVPSKDFNDPDFKRLFYVRYVDDWVILIAGSLEEANVIRNLVSKKLQSLGLTLNLEKTHIT